MPRGDRKDWGGARIPGPNAKRAGRKPASVRLVLGQARMAELSLLATAAQSAPDVLAARWLSERIVAETTSYDKEIL